MNDKIREQVLEALHQQKVSQADLARMTNKTRQSINRALKGTEKGGKVPELWQDIFDALGLELVVQKKDEK